MTQRFLQAGISPAIDWQDPVTVAENEDDNSATTADAARQAHAFRPPAGLVATRLAAALNKSGRSHCYVALSEASAHEIAEALGTLFPDIDLIFLPPWDCLPYDRVPPSPHSMGRRMDALRLWQAPGPEKLLVTSLEAVLQRVPPTRVIADSRLELTVNAAFDRAAFLAFVRQTGYVEEGVADDPGEVVVRECVIDIYPAGAPGPMRIILSADDHILELRGFDRISQRTESFLQQVTLGPASEAICSAADPAGVADKVDTMESTLCRLYRDMPTVFDLLGDTALHFAPGAAERVQRYLDIIDDAREARAHFGHMETAVAASFYLGAEEWKHHASEVTKDGLDLQEDSILPAELSGAGSRRTLAKFVQQSMTQGRRIVVTGRGKALDALSRRLAKATGMQSCAVDSWREIPKARDGSLLRLPCDLRQGFVDKRHAIVVIAAADHAETADKSAALLAEPMLQIGDVVVHEDHGVGVLKDLETIDIEGIPQDAARLAYRDGGSVLVPMQEFDKLWRYGAQAEAVSLDRLHTAAWQNKREKIAKDIRSTARHLAAIARQRQQTTAQAFVPPRGPFLAFARRFPYAETADQAVTITAVLGDLASGRPMNRLVCGDVGYGKTEIALRAAAAVALSGAQAVIIAPTTVLARQHFSTFARRFEGTGVTVGMLSRLVQPGEARVVKSGLAEGRIGVVVATQAILAKDVRFSNLALLVVDEEHRFGLREKRAMVALAPALHMLAMSATPIPRTLQSAMVGIQEVSLLTTAPTRRRPTRTSVVQFDGASLRTGLMREYRRGGQSFVVVPRIEDIGEVSDLLGRIVPELLVKIAHGKMPSAAIDEAVVGFAEGDGDVLLATNIIENGLDVSRANTMFVWRADLFGLAQLHQLRGRVGRGATQGMVTFLTPEGAELAEETRLRLSILVENDRLGSGLSISLRDLDLRGGGDLVGEDQAGHIKALGTGLYRKLLVKAVRKARKQTSAAPPRVILNLDVKGTIPASYVSDAAVRLNLYAKLLRASSIRQLDDLEEEFDDRFGEPPLEVLLLLRITRLQLKAAKLGIGRLEAGPKALAMSLTSKTPAKVIAALTKRQAAAQHEDRVVFEASGLDGEAQLRFFERVMASVQRREKPISTDSD